MKTLTQKTITAVLWNFTGSLGNQIAQFVITIVLARLLLPEQFALIAMLTVFTVIASALIESGYGCALIQLQTVTRVDESSVFYFNLVVSVALYLLFWYLAIPIAAFYHAPELTPITRLLTLTFILNAFGLVQKLPVDQTVGLPHPEQGHHHRHLSIRSDRHCPGLAGCGRL